MAESKNYELASAYVSIMPSLKGLENALAQEIGKASPKIKSQVSKAMGDAGKASSGTLSKSLGNLNPSFKNIGSTIGPSLNSAVSRAGDLFKRSMSAATKTVGIGLAGVVGGITAQTFGGGLNRALDINRAEARLRAFGNTAEEVSSIMDVVKKSVSGTSYGSGEAAGAATQFIAAGIKDTAGLQKALSAVVKLSDMTGASFSEMGSIMSKNAASGIVQMEDLNQIIDRGVPIQAELSKQMGVSVAEVKKLASEGKISYGQLQKAVEGINFDSEIFAKMDVKSAFKNLQAQFSKIGTEIWTPILEKMIGPINTIKNVLSDNGKKISDAISNIFDSIKTAMGDTDNIDIGKTIGETLVKGIIGVANFIASVAPTLVLAVKSVSEVITSDFTQGVLGVIVSISKYLASNQGVLKIAIGALLGFVVIKKALGPVIGVISLMNKIKGKGIDNSAMKKVSTGISSGIGGIFSAIKAVAEGIGTGFEAVIGTIKTVVESVASLISTIINSIGSILKASGQFLIDLFKTLGSVFSSMITALATVGSAVIAGAGPLAALGVFILAVGGIATLLEKMGAFEAVKTVLNGTIEIIGSIIDLLTTTITNLITIITTIGTGIATAFANMMTIVSIPMNLLKDLFVDVLTTIAGIMTTTIPIISDAVNSFIETFSDAFNSGLNSINSLLTNLSLNGAGAGAGGFAAAAGISALAGSLVALGAGNLVGSAMNSLGNIIGSVFGGGDDKDKKESYGIDDIFKMISALGAYTNAINNMPLTWNQVAQLAFNAGNITTQNYVNGLNNGLASSEESVREKLRGMLDRLQEELNAKPLEIKFKDPKLGDMKNGGGSVYNRTNNYDISVRNSDVLKSLEKSSR